VNDELRIDGSYLTTAPLNAWFHGRLDMLIVGKLVDRHTVSHTVVHVISQSSVIEGDVLDAQCRSLHIRV
jgi:hypothetical protein